MAGLTITNKRIKYKIKIYHTTNFINTNFLLLYTNRQERYNMARPCTIDIETTGLDNLENAPNPGEVCKISAYTPPISYIVGEALTCQH